MWLSGLLLATALAVTPAAPAAAPTLPATPQFRHYDVNQGLPTSDIYIIKQDASGILWLGTRAGLVRFDGNDFTIYQHIPGDDTSLAANDTSGLLIDSRGRLWAGGEGSGVNRFDPATETFVHYRHDDGDPHSLSSNDIMALAEGADGTLWVGTWGGGLEHMVAPGHFEHLTHDPDDPASLAADSVLSLASLADGRLLIGTMHGLDIRLPDGRLVHTRFPSLDKPPRIWDISTDESSIRLSTTAGLFLLDADHTAHRFDPGQLPVTNVMSSTRSPDGNLWVGTTDGLYLVEPNGHATHLKTDTLTPGAQPGRLIWHLLVDDEGGLWVTTQNAGIAYLSPDWRDFSHYSHRADDPDSLAGDRIMALDASSDGQLWVGGSNGQLDKLDPRDGRVTHYGATVALGTNTIASIASFDGDKLWLGNHSGLALFDGEHTRQVDSPHITTGVHWVVTGQNGQAWAAPIDGNVVTVDPRTLAVTPVGNAFDGDADKETRDLKRHDGVLWRATHAGLSRLAADRTRFVPVQGVSPGVVDNFCFHDQQLWLVRPDALERYRIDADGKAHLEHRVGTAQGWPGIHAYAMTVDNHDRAWIFSPAGLWRYDAHDDSFRAFGKTDGLPSLEFPAKKLVRDAHGDIFVGSQRGVVGFNPDRLHDHPRAPRLHLTDITVQRGDNTVRLTPAQHALTLEWDDRDLRINAHALSYINPSRNRYRFRLRHLDNDWVDTGNRGRREFAGLTAGNYTLQVQAAGPSGVWGHLATPLAIHVEVPPWNRPWAWLIYILAALLLLWAVATIWRRRLEQRHRLQLLEQEREMARQADAAKSRFLATLSHEIRTPMTGLLGMTELLLGGRLGTQERHCARTIQRSGQLMLKLVNDSLDMTRIEAGRLALDPAPMNPRTLLADIRELQAQQARRKQLAWEVTVHPSVPEGVVGDRHRIQQILLNLTNNAFKFTSHGHVGIDASYADGTLHLCVHDTGPGISAADRERLFHRYEQADSPERHNGAGLGLAICRELVQLMGGRIELASTVGAGSRFDIHLPLPECVPPTAAAATPTASPKPARALELLLVEDDATVAQAVSGVLGQAGHRVTHAAHGLAALEELGSGRFDAILMDMNLPGMDGCQLTGLIRERGNDDAAIPIIAVTARSGTDEERHARDAGMDAFLRKPVTLEDLNRTFERLGLWRGAPHAAPSPPRDATDPA